jgi:ribonuclease-3
MAHPKSALIAQAKRLELGKPTFKTKRTGPEHDPLFLSEVLIADKSYARGKAGTKRDAERRAAEQALEKLQQAGPEAPSKPLEVQQAQQHGGGGDSETFEGPWPIFEHVLASCLTIAHQRIDPDLRNTDAVSEIRESALLLYKTALEDLGEVVEVNEDEQA